MRRQLVIAWITIGAFFVPCAIISADGPSFSHEIVPTLYKLGCSAGECHGSFSGKGNFRLSLFAADAEADDREIHAAFGRRINHLSPQESLLLAKPSMARPHGGGLRLKPDSDEYRLLLDWIEAGAASDHATASHVQSIRVDPPMIVGSVKSTLPPLRVWAKFADGAERDVTRFARFESLDTGLVQFNEGQWTLQRPGDTHLLLHYAGKIAHVAVLIPGELPDGISFPEETGTENIDRLVLEKLKRLNIIPAGICNDNDFLRRLHLDVTGQLPTPDEVRKFVADTSPDKRAAAIDRLLEHPLHAAVWATKMCDAMGADNRTMYDGSVYRIYDWMRNRFERNVPWDKIVRGALTGTIADDRSLEELQAENERLAEQRKLQNEAQKAGKKLDPAPLTDKPWRTRAALRNTLEDFSYNLKFRVQAGPRKGQMDAKPLAQHVATAFLGVRLECAECHKHPHDRWSQQDFFSFTTSFAFLSRGLAPELAAKKLNYINGVYVTDKPQETFPDPKTGEPLPPRALDGPIIDVQPGVDPRLEVWKWMVSRDNPYFARAIVNRLWAHYFGRGLIEPVDALSEANPPSHPEVLDDLVSDFVVNGYDLRRLHRRLLNTRTYQRDWATNATNADDERNYSHRVLRRMSAELMLDAIADITQTPIKLDLTIYGGPGDDRTIERAIENPLSRPRGDDSYVLKIFDKPQRTQSCDCERSSAPNLSQALFFYNDTALVAKITDPDARLTKLLKEHADDQRLLDELYLLVFARLPNDAERQRSREHLAAAKSRAGVLRICSGRSSIAKNF